LPNDASRIDDTPRNNCTCDTDFVSTMAQPHTRRLLGGHDPREFLARFWHKEPLLVPHAAPEYRDVMSPERLFALATRDDVQSRIVQRHRARYGVEHGPFTRAQLARLPARDWTLLVQGVNLHDDAADALLRNFAFIPYARLDDVMVSYAAPGGGVGPHFDSYDVFLLQTHGRRRWRYGRQDDLALRPGVPVRILRHFTPQHDATLAPGDMLYLPPQTAHDGIALDACITCSIGFRAPLMQEIAEAFVDHVRDALDLPGRYADPDLRPTRHPAQIDRALRRRFAPAISGIGWNSDDVARFIGRFVSEPARSVVFERPSRVSRPAFVRRARMDGIRLDRRTQLLYDDTRYYLNGEDALMPDVDRAALQSLADRRMLSSIAVGILAPATIDLLYDWYRHGFVA
jgi:50S ribosomal protein L16 3-hydroxylase